jgi:hypothetical protein
MPKCDCGAEESRTRTTFSGAVSFTVCPKCRPDDFVDKTPPMDKLWRHEDAFPHLYKRVGDVLYAKEELTADTVDNMSGSPTEEAIERKRRNRRTTPLSQWEIEQADKRWRGVRSEQI